MTAVRALSVLFFVIAVLMGISEVITAYMGGTAFHMRSFGEWWYGLSPSSLNGTQAFIQRYLWPPLWDPLIVSFLRLPGVPAAAGIGALLMAISVAGKRPTY